MVREVMNERERKTRILSMLWGGARWCSILSVRGIGGGAAQRGVACARFLPPVGWWHPYLARAVCSVRFEFTTLLGRKIYGALLKAIQTRTGPFGPIFQEYRPLCHALCLIVYHSIFCLLNSLTSYVFTFRESRSLF